MVPASCPLISVVTQVQQSFNKVDRIQQAPNNEIDNVGLLDRLARPDRRVGKMETMMRRILIAAMQAALIGCGPVAAQVGGVGIPTPGIAATSPLGMTPGSSVSPTGIPMGATELASPGLSPATNGAIGMTGFGTTCSAMASPSSGMSSSSTNFDGGGIGVGTGTSLPGSTAVCGTGSSSSASSSAAMSSASPAGGARAGIPMGSVEIGSAGVSPLVVVPVPSPSLSTMGTIASPSTTGALSPSMVGTPSSSLSRTGIGGAPCSSIAPPSPSTGC